MIRKIYILLMVAMTYFFMSCTEKYPDLFLEEPESEIDNLYNKETGAVRIQPSFTDPQYEIITRGNGPYDVWSIDKEKWMNTRFHTFALLKENYSSAADRNGKTDYTATDVSHRLIWDEPLGIVSDDQTLSFLESYESDAPKVNRYYHADSKYDEWKYDFSCFYTDGATASDIVTYKDYATIDVEIDGTNDIMHAFAYHSNEELDKKLQNMSSDVDKIMHERRKDVMYSAIAGRRGFEPKLHINHLLTQLKFKVRGVEGRHTTHNYTSLIIRKIAVKTPYKGTMKVLDSNWSQDLAENTNHYENNYEQQIAERKLLVFKSESPSDSTLINVPIQHYGFDNEWDDESFSYYTGESGIAYNHILSTDPQPLSARDVLVPSSTDYVVYISFDMVLTETDPITGKQKLRTRSDIGTYSFHIHHIIGTDRFEPGHAYTVVFSIYGPEDIEGSIKLDGWFGDKDNNMDIDTANKDNVGPSIDIDY